jgi:hypothetical protein
MPETGAPNYNYDKKTETPTEGFSLAITQGVGVMDELPLCEKNTSMEDAYIGIATCLL